MKTFKVRFKYRICNNAYNNPMRADFQFVKAETEQQAIDLFKSNFSKDIEINISSVEQY